MSGFFIFLVSINLIMIGYVSFRLKALFETPLILIVPFIITVLFVVTRLMGVNHIAWLSKLAAYSFAFLICAVFTSLIFDLLSLLNHFIIKYPLTAAVKQISYVTVLSAMFGVGIYMARVPQTTFYQVNVAKPANIDKLRVVQLSDIHINEITGRGFVEKMVERTNALKPDVIFITGDILDSRLRPYLEQNLSEVFSQLNSKYGSFAVFGNHEYYGIMRNGDNAQEDVLAAFKAGNMTTLQDDIVTIGDTGIVVIGRDDYAGARIGKQRKDLDRLTAGVDVARTPLIVLDHQPFNLPDAAQHGVDIMFSGHTHAGQLFPGTLIVKRMYDNPWGIYSIERPDGHVFNSIVTSGYGLWGPPIRLLTRAEIVVTDVTFSAQ